MFDSSGAVSAVRHQFSNNSLRRQSSLWELKVSVLKKCQNAAFSRARVVLE
jgi:hypothetical protein